MSLQKPVIFIITGAWHVPEHYRLLSNYLRHQGHVVQCPLLPTNSNAYPPSMTLDDDVNQIRTMVLEYLDAGRDVVALMHSYGGVVGSNALAGLGATDRKQGGHVKALVYMSAFIPFETESLAGIFGGGLPPFLSCNDQGLIDVDNPHWHFYHDLTPDQQKEYVDRLACHPVAAQFESLRQPVTVSAWKTIPVTYLFCREDKALPIQVQEMMVDRIEKTEPGLVVDREYNEWSHSPFISVPGKVMAVVERVCEAGEPQQEMESFGAEDQQHFVESRNQTIMDQT